MGLKNKNYEINGYFYPEVYAVFNGKVTKSGNSFVVGFDIHASRDLALTHQPLKSVNVVVADWDRKTDLIALAYQKGKEQLKDWEYDANGRPKVIVIDNVFTGWEDDIR
jgi:hypothetical protein